MRRQEKALPERSSSFMDFKREEYAQNRLCGDEDGKGPKKIKCLLQLKHERSVNKNERKTG